MNSTTHDISEYEKLRLENINRNNELLRALEIERKNEPLITNPELKRNKRKRITDFNVDSGGASSEPLRRSVRVVALATTSVVPFVESISSSVILPKRGRSERATVAFDFIGDAGDSDGDDAEQRSKVTAPQLRKLIDCSNAEHSERISDEVRRLNCVCVFLCYGINTMLLTSHLLSIMRQQAIKHTCYRFSYMSRKALANRLQMITRLHSILLTSVNIFINRFFLIISKYSIKTFFY